MGLRSSAVESVGCVALELSGLRSVASLEAGDVLSVLKVLTLLAVLTLLCSDAESDTDACAAPMGVVSAAATDCALRLSAGAWVARAPGSDISSCFTPGETIQLGA